MAYQLIYKHFILCRFAMDLDKTIDWADADTFGRHLAMAKQAIVPTLENQTKKNFILVFLTHHDTEENTDMLKGLTDKFPVEVVNPVKEAVLTGGRIGNAEVVITSRLDYDDYIDREVVEHIQSLVKENPKAMLYGISTGCTYDMEEKQPYLFATPPYGMEMHGLHAPMLSAIYNLHYVRRPFTVLDLGQHDKCIDTFDKKQGEWLRWTVDSRKIAVLDYLNEVGFLWTRHPLSFTQRDGFLHNTAIKVKISEEDMATKFGFR